MPDKNVRLRAKAERDMLASQPSPWFVELFYTFQDAQNLYMVMEFVAGGDLMTHLQRGSPLTVGTAAFYTAELLTALDCLHKLGYVHRDVKPENLVLTVEGHLKLLDFGVCKWLPPEVRAPTERFRSGRSHERTYSCVGTAAYTAPEVFASRGRKDAGGPGYDFTADLWSCGVIAFEMIHGCIPLRGRNDLRTAQKVCDWRKYMRFPFKGQWLWLQYDLVDALPDNCYGTHFSHQYSPLTVQLLESLICDARTRVPVDKIKRMPFFTMVECPVCQRAVHIEDVKGHVVVAHGSTVKRTSLLRAAFAAWQPAAAGAPLHAPARRWAFLRFAVPSGETTREHRVAVPRDMARGSRAGRACRVLGGLDAVLAQRPPLRPEVAHCHDLRHFPIDALPEGCSRSQPLPKFEPEGLDKDRALDWAQYTFQGRQERVPVDEIVKAGCQNAKKAQRASRPRTPPRTDSRPRTPRTDARRTEPETPEPPPRPGHFDFGTNVPLKTRMTKGAKPAPGRVDLRDPKVEQWR